MIALLIYMNCSPRTLPEGLSAHPIKTYSLFPGLILQMVVAPFPMLLLLSGTHFLLPCAPLILINPFVLPSKPTCTHLSSLLSLSTLLLIDHRLSPDFPLSSFSPVSSLCWAVACVWACKTSLSSLNLGSETDDKLSGLVWYI